MAQVCKLTTRHMLKQWPPLPPSQASRPAIPWPCLMPHPFPASTPSCSRAAPARSLPASPLPATHAYASQQASQARTQLHMQPGTPHSKHSKRRQTQASTSTSTSMHKRKHASMQARTHGVRASTCQPGSQPPQGSHLHIWVLGRIPGLDRLLYLLLALLLPLLGQPHLPEARARRAHKGAARLTFWPGRGSELAGQGRAGAPVRGSAARRRAIRAPLKEGGKHLRCTYTQGEGRGARRGKCSAGSSDRGSPCVARCGAVRTRV